MRRMTLKPLKPLRERNPVVVGTIGLLILAVVALLAYRADDLPLIGGGTTYHADFTESAGLRTGDEVRIAGVRVGQVTSVALDGDRVRVGFRTKGAWIGDASTVGIAIKTLLGAKYLAVEPLGASAQNPADTIPEARTTSPFDVQQAFNGLAHTVGRLDTGEMAKSLQALSQAFKGTPPDVRKALDGLSALSTTIASRDVQLSRLLGGTRQVTATLDTQTGHISTLLQDGNLLLSELQQRRDAISALLSGTRQLSVQLSGLVNDDGRQLAPTLDSLSRLTQVLLDQQTALDKALAVVGPYYRLLGNTLGNGRWFDTYLCGLVPRSYLPAGTGVSSGCMSPKVTSGGKK